MTEWQDISTAPKDGPTIAPTDLAVGFIAYRSVWHDGEWHHEAVSLDDLYAAPPATNADSDGDGV